MLRKVMKSFGFSKLIRSGEELGLESKQSLHITPRAQTSP